MRIRRSKILYLSILAGLIALALLDIKQQNQKTISYRIESSSLINQMVVNPIYDQNIIADEKDHFYSGLLPCD